MAEERVERRLTAILAADVAGYSRLIGVDEEGTLAAQALRAELIDPGIAEHHGRIVKTTGDGLLVEFASVVDAVRCAAAVQRAMAERNTAIPADRRLEFRIGIHQGDIVLEGGDIFGDGVNVAARLEGLAEPGGICVSARVQEDAAGRLDLAFEVEHVFERAVEAVSPEVCAGLGLDQLRRDAHPPAAFAHRAFEHVADPQFAPDLLHILPLVGEARIAGDAMDSAYSPDLNPIEQVFAKLKHLLRTAAARNLDAVCAAIAQLLDNFTPQQCANCVANSGYART